MPEPATLPEDFTIAYQYIAHIDTGEIHVYEYENHFDTDMFILLSFGSEFDVKIYNPQGSLVAEKQSSVSPIAFSIPGADAGLWKIVDAALKTSRIDAPYSLTVALPDEDRDGLPDSLEESSCTEPDDSDSDDDGILDGIEDSNHNGTQESGETDPCKWDTDGDGLSDGEEDASRNGYRDPGELDPLDDDGVNDGLEKKIGTDPMDQGSWPHIVCIGDQDDTCHGFAPDVSGALEMTSREASVNYLRVRNVIVEESGVEIAGNITIGIE